MLSPRQFEAAAEKLVRDMNAKYFNNAAFVVGVKLAKFDKRGSERVVLGEYATSTSCIYLNYHLRTVLSVSGQRFKRAYMSVVWHELCHAMLITALQPHRLGLYRVRDHHGPEFMQLYNMRKHNAPEEEMDALFQVVGSRQMLVQTD